MPLVVKTQRTDEWWAAHLNKITGSTAAGCLGVVKDFAPITAYKQIKQLSAEKSNWYTEYGHRMEGPARRAYERLTDNLIWETGFWVHPLFPWLGSSPDGIGTGLLEVKCPQLLPTEVPVKHEIQCRVAMAVCNLPYCDYFAWNPSLRPNHFLVRIHRDTAKELDMLAALMKFFIDHIKDSVPPKRRKRTPKPKENETDGRAESETEAGRPGARADVRLAPGTGGNDQGLAGPRDEADGDDHQGDQEAG